MRGATDWRALLLEGAAVLAIALAVRVAGIGQDAGGDELYHILAARQYLVDGTLSIHGAAPYTRAREFTLLVAWLFRIFGESPVVARIPALLAGSLTALLVFLWLRSLGEHAGAWVAGLLVALDPELIKLSQWARFYTLQHLAFLAGVIAVFALLSGPWRPARFLPLAAVAGLAFWTAVHFQVITKIGLGGVGLYACALSVPALSTAMARRDRAWLVPLGVVAAVGAGIFLAYRLGMVEEARRLGTETDLWAAKTAGHWRHYHALLQENYPTLWTLYPLLLLACAAWQPRLALLCGCIFGTAFVAHSFVAMKHPRYLAYALPFLLIPSGIAVARAVPRIVSLLAGIHLPWPDTPARRRLVARVLVGLVAAFAILANPAFVRTARLLTFDPTLRQPGMEHEGLSWRRAAERLRPVVESVEVVVSADDLSTLYYLGRLDYVISASQLDLEKTGVEFTPDQSTGVPLVSRPESLERILACHASGLIVARAWSLASDWAVPPDTASFIASHTTPLTLPEEWGVRAFSWRAPDFSRPADCPQSGTIRAALPR